MTDTSWQQSMVAGAATAPVAPQRADAVSRAAARFAPVPHVAASLAAVSASIVAGATWGGIWVLVAVIAVVLDVGIRLRRSAVERRLAPLVEAAELAFGVAASRELLAARRPRFGPPLRHTVNAWEASIRASAGAGDCADGHCLGCVHRPLTLFAAGRPSWPVPFAEMVDALVDAGLIQPDA